MNADEATWWAKDARVALGNPFDDPGAFEAACASIRARWKELPGALRALSDGEHKKETRRLILAAGHVQALDGQQALLDESMVPRSAWTASGLSRAGVLPILAAAARCRLRLKILVGVSDAMARLRGQVWQACFGSSLEEALRLAPVIRQQKVLILGETGTGKELVAEAIQDGTVGGADGSSAPRQSLNAAAIPRELVESELFGHVRGAFSGAVKDRKGKIVAASGGTLLLDEIADLPASVQPKLLRVIESGEVVPVGSNTAVHVDVRYVAATMRPINEMVASGAFRHDLYERVAGTILKVPPLRARPDDIVPIGRAITARLLHQETTNPDAPGRTAISGIDLRQASIGAWLMSREAREHSWPGNVRELENAIRSRLLGMDEGTRTPAPAPVAAELRGPPGHGVGVGGTPRNGEHSAGAVPESVAEGKATLKEVVDWYVARALDHAGGNQSRAAKALGIDRGTLARQLQRMGERE